MALDGIQNYLIGIILFVVIITGGILFVGSAKTYDVTIDANNNVNEYNGSLNKATEITTSVNQIQSSITGVGEGGVLGWFDAVFGSAYRGLKTIFGSISFMNIVLEDTAQLEPFNIPIQIIVLIELVVVIIIGFAIWSAIMKV